MSKAKGTGVDPLQLTEQYGTDALRYMLASMAAPGTDISLSEDRILGGRAFANKIWNAARFLFVNLEKLAPSNPLFEALWGPEARDWDPSQITSGRALVHRWIFSRLSETASQVNEALEGFRFHEAAQTIYHFFWGDFCDWYIEWLKPELLATDHEIAFEAWRNILFVFNSSLRLIHPVMPFLTEELWHSLHPTEGARSIAFEPYPEPLKEWSSASADEEMETIKETITKLREIRAELKLDPKRKVPAYYSAENPLRREFMAHNQEAIVRFACLSELHISAGHLSPTNMIVRSGAEFDVGISYGETVDKQAEVLRLRKDIERLEKDIEAKKERQGDSDFRNRAPAKVVEDLAVKLAERQLERKKLLDRLAQLE
jgi:valyl-tRNA synthetase